jgi:hypothetical protein
VPVTCEAGKQGEGAVPAAPDPGSVTDAAIRALAEFGKAERVVGSIIAHATFDGVLAEHALALEDARDMLSEALRGHTMSAQNAGLVGEALVVVREQIEYIRALGSVAQKEEDDGAG